MIYGIGTDVCDIRRIEAAVQRHGERFAEKILGSSELQIYQRRHAKVKARGLSFLATRFAAKEAFSKAIGTGMHAPMWWTRCEILPAPGGKPQVVLHGVLKDWCDEKRLKFHVSVSDECDTAISMVICEHI